MIQILVYWIGNIGIVGKGPNWMERYDPNRTIGDLIHINSNNNKKNECCNVTCARFDRPALVNEFFFVVVL